MVLSDEVRGVLKVSSWLPGQWVIVLPLDKVL